METVDESTFLTALMDFCSMVLHVDVPAGVRPLFLAASLLALCKKSSGVRLIAVRCTLRCLIAKIASMLVREQMVSLLAPKQLGFWVRDGAEAAVHAAGRFLSKMLAGHEVVKLDFQNAFNSLYGNKMLEAPKDLAPDTFFRSHRLLLFFTSPLG